MYLEMVDVRLPGTYAPSMYKLAQFRSHTTGYSVLFVIQSNDGDFYYHEPLWQAAIRKYKEQCESSEGFVSLTVLAGSSTAGSREADPWPLYLESLVLRIRPGLRWYQKLFLNSKE
ncbi:hypothetical protein Lumi_114 [Xylophilus phage Lumi]|nr:hypothetical protein Lumi_114 [Xylophilus phage Lumi]